MFQSLEIKNFRGFAKLTLGDLGRVNLIVGKNNTGKTSLLEAITLLASPMMHTKLPGLFRSTNETSGEVVGSRFFRWLPRDGNDGSKTVLSGTERGASAGQVFLGMTLDTVSGLPPGSKFFGNSGGLQVWSSADLKPAQVHAVSVQHQTPDEMVDAFAEAVRSPQDERQMESLLALVDPRIRTVRLDSVKSKPFIVVDVGLSERVPLPQAGQGIYRLVAIFSELLGRKPKVCCIDEIENGIHYSALPSVWAGIAEVAARLDIQVFATTHSWECLLAAHEAFASRDPYDFRVLQLYRLGDAINGRVLDRDHIEAAIAGEIELR